MNYIINKKWITGCFLAGMLLVMPGCDLLDQAPLDTLTRDEFFETEADALGSLISVYDALQASVGRMGELGEARGDLVQSFTNNVYREQIVEPISPAAKWVHFYNIINRANTTIKYVPGVVKKDARFTQEESDALVAEAYYLRALAYFYLIRVWGEVPLILVPSDTDDQDYNFAKSSQDVILDQIEADLAIAEKSLANSFPSQPMLRGRATKGALYAMQTDVYLWRNKYQLAVDAANKVISNSNYSLVPATRWPFIFFEPNSTEGIFEVQFDFNANETNTNTPNYSNNYIISNSHLQRYLDEQDAVRGENASYRGGGFFGIWKFIGAQPNGTSLRPRSDVNWIIYRLADVYLMRAEALNRLNRKAEAIADIKKIREQRSQFDFALSENNSVDEIEDAVLHERALELAFEGKRWFDLVRIANRGRPNVLKTLVLESYPEARIPVIEARIADPRSWYLPIHESEITSNKNLVQNPYYN